MRLRPAPPQKVVDDTAVTRIALPNRGRQEMGVVRPRRGDPSRRGALAVVGRHHGRQIEARVTGGG